MADYIRLAQTAKRLIEKNGRSLQFQKRDTGPLDDAKPWRGPDMEFAKTTTVKGVFVAAVGEEIKGTVEDDDGSETSRNSDQFLVAALSTEEDLTKYQTVYDGTEFWEIVAVHPLRPGDTNLLYSVEVKR